MRISDFIKQQRAALYYSMLAIISMVLLSACSSDVKEDTEELLRTVPSNSEYVMVINLEKTINGLGGKASGGKIKDAPKDLKLLMINPNHDEALKGLSEMKEAFKDVKISSIVMFARGGDVFITGFLNDPEEFRNALEKSDEFHSAWEKEGEYYVGNGIVTDDERFWASSRGGDDLVGLIQKFKNLPEKDSFISNPYAETLATSDKAMTFCISLENLMQTQLSFSEQFEANMALNMAFDSPKYLVGNLDIDKDKMEGEAELLNKDFKPSKCELKLSKIDPKRIESIGGQANTVMAFAVSQDFIGQIKDLQKSLNDAFPSYFMEMVEPVDGTIVVASPAPAKSIYDLLLNYRAVIPTTGMNNAYLAQGLGEIGEVEVEGTTLNISKGNYGRGELNLKEVAKEFKDSYAGVALYLDNSDTKGGLHAIMTLRPAGDSVKLVFTVK